MTPPSHHSLLLTHSQFCFIYISTCSPSQWIILAATAFHSQDVMSFKVFLNFSITKAKQIILRKLRKIQKNKTNSL